MAIAAQLGTAVAASLGLAIGGGYLLDKWLNTRPLLTLAGIIVGLVASWYTIAELVTEFPAKVQRGKRQTDDE